MCSKRVCVTGECVHVCLSGRLFACRHHLPPSHLQDESRALIKNSRASAGVSRRDADQWRLSLQHSGAPDLAWAITCYVGHHHLHATPHFAMLDESRGSDDSYDCNALTNCKLVWRTHLPHTFLSLHLTSAARINPFTTGTHLYHEFLFC